MTTISPVSKSTSEAFSPTNSPLLIPVSARSLMTASSRRFEGLALTRLEKRLHIVNPEYRYRLLRDMWGPKASHGVLGDVALGVKPSEELLESAEPIIRSRRGMDGQNVGDEALDVGHGDCTDIGDAFPSDVFHDLTHGLAVGLQGTRRLVLGAEVP